MFVKLHSVLYTYLHKLIYLIFLAVGNPNFSVFFGIFSCSLVSNFIVS